MKTIFSEILIELRQKRNIHIAQIAYYIDYSMDEYKMFEEGLGFPPEDCFEKIKEFYNLEDKDLMPVSLDSYNLDLSYEDRLQILQYDYLDNEQKKIMKPVMEQILEKYA